jgi:hypothetical protein
MAEGSHELNSKWHASEAILNPLPSEAQQMARFRTDAELKKSFFKVELAKYTGFSKLFKLATDLWNLKLIIAA